jgi:hypothetical protein
VCRDTIIFRGHAQRPTPPIFPHRLPTKPLHSPTPPRPPKRELWMLGLVAYVDSIREKRI